MRLVLVPGFTQTASAWDPVRAELHVPGSPSQARAPSSSVGGAAELGSDGDGTDDVVALDVPTGLDFAATAHALGETGGRAVYAGYSRGGRLCLQLALDRPDVVAGLVLISGSPGIADATERAARRDADEQLAAELERDGLEPFLRRWLAQPLFASLPEEDAGLDIRLAENTVPALAHELRALGQGVQEPLWDRLGDLAVPFIPVAGNLDEKYVAIAHRMAAATGVEAVVIRGAGHAVHLEQPGEVARVLDHARHATTS